MKKYLFPLLLLCFSLCGFSQEESPKEKTTEAPATAEAAKKTPADTKKEEVKLSEKINKGINVINDVLAAPLFFDISFGKAAVHKVDKDGHLVYSVGKGDDKKNIYKTPEGKMLMNKKIDAVHKDKKYKKTIKVPADESLLSSGKQPEPTMIGSIPLLVVVLVCCGIFFTLYFGFPNLRFLRHSFDVLRGKYDDPNDDGDISHFKALCSALSATVGLGNIAGVAIAMSMGGPGALFWMFVAAFFGMTMKFASCVLAQKFRTHNPDGTISGGPMYYLEQGLAEKGGLFKKLGSVLAVFYALLVILGCLGGGNMFQGNQAFAAVNLTFFDGSLKSGSSQVWIFAIVMAVMVGLVIIGGIKRIGKATEVIVPFMCGLYVIVSLVIIGKNFNQVGAAFSEIFSGAFNASAMYGGFAGVLIMGFKRASFSNEAGLGSASIAHAAAQTKYPVREGIVAMVGPVIDTMIVCTMTALVIIITKSYDMPEHLVGSGLQDGAPQTIEAWSSLGSFMPKVLTLCIILYAFSTMISWCYYGERGYIYLLDRFMGKGKGQSNLIYFRLFYCFIVMAGVVASSDAIITFSDLAILGMALPNLIGVFILAPKVKGWLGEYAAKYKAGEFKKHS